MELKKIIRTDLPQIELTDDIRTAKRVLEDYPCVLVHDRGTFAGLLRPIDLIKNESASIQECLPDIPSITQEQDILSIHNFMINEGINTLPAIINGEFKGVVCLPEISDYIAMHFKNSITIADTQNITTEPEEEEVNSELRREIIERRLTEEALIESENRYRTFLNMANDAIVIIDTETEKILHANLKALSLTGKSVNSIQETKFSDLYPAEKQKAFNAILEKHIKNGSGTDELLLCNSEGMETPVEISTSVFKINNRNVLQAILRDITERKKAEEALRESEAKWRSLVQNAPELITTLSIDGTVLFTNWEKPKYSGSTEKIIGKNIHGYLEKEESQELKHILDKLFQEGTPGKYYSKNQLKDGETAWFKNSVAPIRDGQRITGAIIVSMDITQRKKIEENLNLYKNIVSASKDLLGFIEKKNYRVTAVNAQMCNYTNKNMKSILGVSLRDLFDKDFFDLYIKGYCDKALDGYDTRFERWLYFSGRGKRYIEVDLHPYKDSSGEITGIIAEAQDNTERVRFEKIMVDISQEERRNLGIELHDGLSHQLLGIGIKARMLTDKLTQSGSHFAQIAGEIETMINQAIEDTRYIAGGLFPAHLEDSGIQGEMDRITVDIIKQHNIKIRSEIDPEIEYQDLTVRQQLFFIIKEALHNIIRHSEANEVEIKIICTDEKTTLKIKDNGKGFNLSESTGKGLGLSIMSYRARTIGASIDIHCPESGGTEISCSMRKEYP